MMASGDLYLGKIIPVILRVEECLLKHAFGMRLGWGENTDKYDNIEDGQLEGVVTNFLVYWIDRARMLRGAETDPEQLCKVRYL